MKFEKLSLENFKQNGLSFSKLKSLVGGAEYTHCGNSNSNYCDYIDNLEQTKFDCDDTKYNDGCSDS